MVELNSKLWVDSQTKKQKTKINQQIRKKNLYRMYVYLELFYIWFNNWKWGRSILLKVMYGFNPTLYIWQVSFPSWWRMLQQPQAEMRQIHSFPTNPQKCASEKKKNSDRDRVPKIFPRSSTQSVAQYVVWASWASGRPWPPSFLAELLPKVGLTLT